MSKSGGDFQFFGGRMTSRGQCPRRGVLVNVQEWGCFSIFWGADDVTRRMSKGGGVLVNVVTTPPPFRKSCIRACVPPIQVQTPPPTWLAGYGPEHLRVQVQYKCFVMSCCSSRRPTHRRMRRGAGGGQGGPGIPPEEQ